MPETRSPPHEAAPVRPDRDRSPFGTLTIQRRHLVLKVDEAAMKRIEKLHPGIREDIDSYESLNLPPCPSCGSADTAAVSAGIVGRSIHVAVATTKIRLLPNPVPEDYFCNRCREYFDVEDSAAEASAEGSLLLNPLTATDEDLESFVRAILAEGKKSERIARRSDEATGQ